MYGIALRVCVLVILGLLANHARDVSTGGYNFVLSAGLTLLFSCEMALGYALFVSDRPFVRKALGCCLALHAMYPLYLAVALSVVTGGAALLEPLTVMVLLGVVVALSVAYALIRSDASEAATISTSRLSLSPVFFFLTYTPFIVLAVRTGALQSGLANDYNVFLYIILAELGLSLASRRLIRLVAPSIALLSVIYIVIQLTLNRYTGGVAGAFLALHGAYAAGYGVIAIQAFRRKAV